jgi:hypothetical protein
MTVKLTDRFLASRKAPALGRTIYTDSTVPGLTFRVSAPTKSNSEGRRDWLLRYRPRRQAQKAVALGAYPAVSLSMARERAGAIVAAAKRGIDLIATEEREEQAQRAAQAKARPLVDIANEYLDSVKHLRSWRSIESRTRCHIIPKLGSKPVAEVTRADVVDFLDRLERGQGLRHQVNRCRETLRAIFAYAIERELVTVNPIVGASKRKEIPRDRTLTDGELTALWMAIEKLPELPRAYFRLVLLTGGSAAQRGARQALKPFVLGWVDYETAEIIPRDLDDRLALRERELSGMRLPPFRRRNLALLCQYIGVFLKQWASANQVPLAERDAIRYVATALDYAGIENSYSTENPSRFAAVVFPKS